MALRIAVFGSGAVLMALEVLAFRIIGKTFGTALRETTAVITIFLISMSLGYWLGGKAGDRWPGGARSWCQWPAPESHPLHPLLDETVSERIFDSALPLGLHALVACALFFVVPLAAHGHRLAGCHPHSSRKPWADGQGGGSVSALSTVGSILGTILMGFYLIDAFGSVKLLTVALGGTMLVLSALAALGMRLKPAAAAWPSCCWLAAGLPPT